MIVLWIVHLIFLLTYTFIIIWFAIGWYKTKPFAPAKKDFPSIFFSVVIALRNEEKNIRSLIQSLNNIEYPNFEVIFVNDHSDDQTRHLLESAILNISNYNLLDLPKGSTGKKAAVRCGIEAAHGKVIAFTDADCILPKQWLLQYNNFYHIHNKPDMIVGLVDMLPAKGVLQTCFRLDFLSLVVSSAGSTSLGKAMFNNAANYAVKRETLSEITESHSHLASGDDVFRLHNFKSQKKRIELLKSNNALVTTPPPKNTKEFLNQRIRWASKSSNYTDKFTVFVAVLVFLYNLSFIFLLPFAAKPYGVSIPIISFGIKTLTDLSLFFSARHTFKLKNELLLVPFFELIYPFYIVYTTILSQKKPFLWKGRIVR